MTMMMWLTLCRPPWASASLDPVKERKRRTAHNAALSARCMVILLSRNFLFDFDKGNDLYTHLACSVTFETGSSGAPSLRKCLAVGAARLYTHGELQWQRTESRAEEC